MTYDNFKKDLIERLSKYYSNEVKIYVKEVLKNNGVRLEGLNIVHDSNERVFPTIYLKDLYEMYVDEEKTIDEIVDWVIDTRESRSADDYFLDVALKLTDWDFVSEYVYPALLSTERNEDLLKELVSRPFLDLSIVYIIRIPTDMPGRASNTKITFGMLEKYGITIEELHEKAMSNLREKDKAEVKSIGDVLEAMTGMAVIPDTENTAKLYVLYNEMRDFGAAHLLNIGNILESKDQAYYVIPSSIHEAILVSFDNGISEEVINDMIQEINQTELDARDVLSDHVYYYDGKGDTISMCA